MENLGKQVVDISTGKIVGWILDVALDENLQKIGYYVVDEESEDELLLPLKNIFAQGGEFVTIADAAEMQFVLQDKIQILGKRVIGNRGENFGVVQKMQFFRQKCCKICTEKCEICTKHISKIGRDAIVVAFGRRKKKLQNEGFPRATADTKVSIQNFANLQATTNFANLQTAANPNFATMQAPTSANFVNMQAVANSKFEPLEKVQLSSSFYVGKICTQNIVGYNNEKIVSKGQTITKSIVEKAKRHNKLNQLFFAIERK